MDMVATAKKHGATHQSKHNPDVFYKFSDGVWYVGFVSSSGAFSHWDYSGHSEPVNIKSLAKAKAQ